MRNFLLLIVMLLSNLTFAQVDSIQSPLELIDTVHAHEDIDIWDPTLFSAIPKDEKKPTLYVNNYEEVLSRYQTEDYIYSENIKDRISFFEKIFRRIKNWLNHLIPDSSLTFEEPFYYFLGFIGLVLLGFIFYKLIYSGNSFFRKEQSDLSADDIGLDYVEKNLMHTNLNPYLTESINNHDYALAIRYLQLMNIQQLAEANLIKWKYSKTNNDLALEIKDSRLQNGFQACTRVFEYVWFGNFKIKSEDFERYQQEFKTFQSQIS